jgi:hypothetical protein
MEGERGHNLYAGSVYDHRQLFVDLSSDLYAVVVIRPA